MYYLKQISWIYDIDFIPEKIDYYKEWPDPYKSQALKALEYRSNNFENMCKSKLKSYE